MTEILIILGLILINGIFSMAEIALVSARKSRLEGQASKGDEKAKAALKLANHPDVFLSTVQVGITLIGILTGIFSGENLKTPIAEYFSRFDWSREYSNGIATTVIVVILTYFSLVLGELVPKRIGLAKPESIAKQMAKPMSWLSRITFPFIWLLTSSTNVIVKLFKLKVSDNQVTEEEIKAMISEGSEHGAIEEEEKEIIERLFHLGDRNITSLMTHRTDIIWFDEQETVQNFKDRFEVLTYSTYPVCNKVVDDITGVVFVKDIVKASATTILKDLAKPAMFVPENNSAYQLLEKFKSSKIHSCFIVNEYGTLEGMITLNDVLEAIVGDVPQSGQEEYGILERSDGSFLVDAQIPFYDFLSHFEKTEWMNEGEQDFDTLAGFVLHELEHIPATGETFDWNGFEFEIIDMDGQRIDKLIVKISEEIKEEMEE
ncbi:MAG: HlyC/CorC family transporter [Chitinophagaceae bacterium]|nr:HlyC/CorC family transporter [Chitinophagaceae bacterium]MBK7559512.1 HlyC/CorC family transporter [Chitinophagaceae bacterium]MBK9531117.1 HlyC/CorC family transporter [Chitinophagaceae bacterium]HQW93025.1 hemolysin family protein [Ferruginibacter sp.]